MSNSIHDSDGSALVDASEQQLDIRPSTALVLQALPIEDRNPAAVYLARLQPSGARTMRQALNTMATMLGVPLLLRTVLVQTKRGSHEKQEDWTCLRCNWGRLEYQHTAAIRAQLQARYGPATANKMLAALRGVLDESWRLGYMNAEHLHRAKDLKPIRGETLPQGRALGIEEIDALMLACERDQRPIALRDAVLVAILYSTGLRRSEIVALSLTDYDPRDGTLIVRRGKGRKERRCFIMQGIKDLVDQWIRVRGPLPGALLVPFSTDGSAILVDGSGAHRSLGHLQDQAVFDILAKRAKEAGLSHFSPHDMRRTFITNVLNSPRADLAIAQRLAGHSNPKTTARYDMRGEQKSREVLDDILVPEIPNFKQSG